MQPCGCPPGDRAWVPTRGCEVRGKEVVGLWRTASESTLTLRPVTPFASPLRPPLQCPTVTSLRPLVARPRHMGAQVQEWPRTRVGSAGRSCAHRICPVQAQRAHGGVPAFPGSPHFPGPRACSDSARQGTARDPPERTHAVAGTSRVSHLDSASPGAASRVRPGSVGGRASSAPGRSPHSLRPSWALAARRSPRSPAAHVMPRAPRRLAGGSASGARPIG